MNKADIIEVINTKFTGQSVQSSGSCVYLEGDKRCAIGLFIPDGHDAQHYMGIASNLLRAYPDLKPFMPHKDPRVLDAFQEIHDFGLNNRQTLDEQKLELIKFVNNNM